MINMKTLLVTLSVVLFAVLASAQTTLTINRAVEVSFVSQVDVNYTLQKTDNIIGPWITTETVPGNNGAITRYYTATNMAQFYRALETYTGPYTYTVAGGAATITGYTSTNKNVIIPNTIMGLPVTTIGFQAFMTAGLTSLTIGTNVNNIGDYAFAYCYSLTNVTIGNSVTSIGVWAFGGCISLTSIMIPDNVTTIENSAFQGTGLTNITIPNSVTIIHDRAFAQYPRLTTVTIPGSVTSIEEYAFFGCPNLTGVYFEGNAPSLGADVFWDTPNAIVYYLYETTGWDTTYGGRPTVCLNPPPPAPDYTYFTNNGTITITHLRQFEKLAP